MNHSNLTSNSAGLPSLPLRVELRTEAISLSRLKKTYDKIDDTREKYWHGELNLGNHSILLITFGVSIL